MKKYFQFCVFSIVFITCLGGQVSLEAQSPVLVFDGNDDYVDLGSEAGNTLRTIELWFQPGMQIDSSLEMPLSLVVRNTEDLYNSDEFSLNFQPAHWPNPGTLRFDITETIGSSFQIYSDFNFWGRKKWYHVAAVVHPDLGMMLFINGEKQASTNNYSSSPRANSFNTTLGCWGNRIDLNRFFIGSLEDVRFSSEALYIEDFAPECPNLSMIQSTIGLWHFDEASGDLALDAGNNNFHGEINGAVRESVLICERETTQLGDLIEVQKTEVFPNPATNYISFSVDSSIVGNSDITIYDSQAREVLTSTISQQLVLINLEKLQEGIYFYAIRKEGKTIDSGKIVKSGQ